MHILLHDFSRKNNEREALKQIHDTKTSLCSVFMSCYCHEEKIKTVKVCVYYTKKKRFQITVRLWIWEF